VKEGTFTGSVDHADATGTIRFVLDGASIGVVALSGGQATLVVPYLSVGGHVLPRHL
jgi:hypothetical protein